MFVKSTSNDIEAQLAPYDNDSEMKMRIPDKALDNNFVEECVPSEEIYSAFCDEDWAVVGRSSQASIALFSFSLENIHFLMFSYTPLTFKDVRIQLSKLQNLLK